MTADRDAGLRRYAGRLAAWDRGLSADGEGNGDGPWRRVLLSRPLREAARLLLTRLAAPWSIWRARRLGRGGPLRLHLGCGHRRLPGWVNVDLAGGRAELAWDLRRRLPFAAGSAQAVFAEHLLEHLPLAGALTLAEEIRRVLRPGGIVRLGVPDFRRYAEAYLGQGDLIDRYRPGRPTPLLAVSEVAYLHGHRSLWDAETLVRLLSETGFEQPAARASGASAIEPAPDDPDRRSETLYVEASR